MSIFNRARSHIFVALTVLAVALISAAACSGDGDGDGGVDGDGDGGQTPSAGETPSSETPSAGETPAPADDKAEITMVPILKFDKAELTVSEGEVTVTADNTDTGSRHSFAVFQSEVDAVGGGEPIAQTEICLAPCVESVTFDTPDSGEYFFRCQVHPTRMTGIFIVE